MAGALVKSVMIDLGVRGDVDSKAKIDALDAQAEALKKAFPTYSLKVDSAAATAKLGVFRSEFKKVADAVTKPQDVQILTAKGLKSLAGIQATAEELRAKFPQFTVRINDKAAKAELDLFAAEAKGKLDKIDKEIAGAGSGGILSKIGGLFGGGGSASSGASGGAGAAQGATPLLGNPYVLAGAAGVALAALPFLAQAAAGAITFSLGGALAALGIAGAQGTAKVQAAFTGLKMHASADLKAISASFVPVMANIYTTATGVLGKLTPVFAGAEKVIAGPFQVFGDTLLKTFASPAVKTSIGAVAGAFGKLLTALSPSLAGDANNIASGITKVADAVGKNPDAFRNFISFLAATAGGALTAIAGLTRFASYIEAHFIPVFDGVRHEIANVWDDVNSNTIDVWNKTWTQTIGRAIQGGHDLEDVFNNVKQWLWNDFLVPAAAFFTVTLPRAWSAGWNAMARVFGGIRSTFLTGIRTIVDAFLNLVSDIIGGAARAFGWVPGIGGKLRAAAAQFDQFRKNVNASLGGINGRTVTVSVAMTSSTNPYPGGISGRAARGMYVASGRPGVDDQLILAQRGEVVVPTHIVAAGAVDHLRGRIPGFAGGGAVGLNVTASTPGAAAITSKLLASVDNLAAAFGKAAAAGSGAAAGTAGSGVQRWRPTVLQALKMEGLAAFLVSDVLYQMQTESGGNQYAINLSDINAQQGDPSRGLMQVIGATFARWHWPGTSFNIYDPLANIAAALNYANNTPSVGFGSGPGQLGSGHGYDHGGVLMPGLTLAYNGTGRPEQVIPAGAGKIEVTLSLHPSFARATGLTPEQLRDIQYTVRTKGGGDVQAAFGGRR